MTYFIVNASYEKCFDLFFQQELGYPNFYRMNELISSDEIQYEDLVLLVPYPSNAPSMLAKIIARINELEVKSLQFGEGVETAFTFNEMGKLRIHSHFEASLLEALSEFCRLDQPLLSNHSDNQQHAV